MRKMLVFVGVFAVATQIACARMRLHVGNGVSSPQAVKQVRPEYPDAAKKNGRQGTVLVDCVVLPDGTVGETQVTRSSLDPTLDKAAIAALKQYRFNPGMKDGKPVSVKVPVSSTFTLR